MNKTNWEKRYRHMVAYVSRRPLEVVEVELKKSKKSNYYVLNVSIDTDCYNRSCVGRDALFSGKCVLLAQLVAIYSDWKPRFLTTVRLFITVQKLNFKIENRNLVAKSKF